VVGGWRKLHNEDLHNLFASPYIVRVANQEDGMGGVCSMRRRAEKCVQNFGRKA
jgi:hypothetical protein